MKFILEIELGNDAMKTPEDIGNALAEAEYSLTHHGSVYDRYRTDLENIPDGVILDISGNTVGSYRVEKD
jgi:hypothetical protein